MSRKGEFWDPLPRFWAKVDRTEGCWVWTGNRDGKDYGTFVTRGRRTWVHRFSWTLHNGPIPDGMLVLHRCDNPPCVRPDHLFLGTHADNAADKIAKGRALGGHVGLYEDDRHVRNRLAVAKYRAKKAA